MSNQSENGHGLPARPCSEYIFEIADVTDEEAYYTIGTFLSLEEAVAAIEAKKEPWTLCESAMFAADYASMEIRKKKLAILDPMNNGEVVWARKWNNVYDEDSDDNDWRVIIPNA